MAARSALIIATSAYEDPKLPALEGPAHDARELQRVLSDPAIGGFDVEIAENESEYALRRRLNRFLSDRGRDDLILLHFSCHGLKDDEGDLYFAAADTRHDQLFATGIEAGWVSKLINRCRSQRIVLMLDCCFGGAFSSAMTRRAAGTESVGIGERFPEGKGRVVLTASTATQYAFEAGRMTGEAEPSIFTKALVDGLATGAADRDMDGQVSVDELYEFALDQVRERGAKQTPTKSGYVEGGFFVARSQRKPPVAPLPLPRDLRRWVDSPDSLKRLAAILPLEHLLNGSKPGMVATALETLEQLTSDDSRKVSDAAAAALTRARPTPEEPPQPGAPASSAEAVLAPNASSPRRVGRTPVDARTDQPVPEASVREAVESRKVTISAAGAMPNAEAETQVAPTARPVRRQRIRIKEIARFPHGAGVAIVVFSPDGRMLASAGNERIVQVRDGLTGSLLGGLEHGPVTFIRALAFSPDSRWLVTGSDDWGVRRWDLGNATAHRFRERSLPGDQTSVKANHKDVHDVRFSADGRYLASAGGESEAQVRVWDITRKAGATILKHPATVRAVAFHPGGLLLATGGDDKAARMWDISTSKELAKVSWSAFFDWQTNVVTFSPDGRWVASGGQTEILRLWEPRTGKVRKELAVGAWVKSTQFSPDGRFIVTGGQGNNGQIWDVSLAKQLAVLKHSGTVNCVAYRADGQYIATASDDATVRIWESPTGKEVAHLTHEGGVKHVAFNPAAAAMIATGSSDKTARLWKVPI